ncbi:hypothetical protein Trydic_g1915 [Trypoxylus dichotomus]
MHEESRTRIHDVPSGRRLLSVKNYVVPEMTLKLPWANATLKDVKFEPLYDYVVDTFNMDLDKAKSVSIDPIP